MRVKERGGWMKGGVCMLCVYWLCAAVLAVDFPGPERPQTPFCEDSVTALMRFFKAAVKIKQFKCRTKTTYECKNLTK